MSEKERERERPWSRRYKLHTLTGSWILTRQPAGALRSPVDRVARASTQQQAGGSSGY